MNYLSNMDHNSNGAVQHGSISIKNFRIPRSNGQKVSGAEEGIEQGWIETISHTQAIDSVS